MGAYTGPYSTDTGAGLQGLSINDNRRMFNFGERIAELAPQQSPFFVYLSKVAKKPTDDPVFKFLEQRHQWQRRNFSVKTGVSNMTATAAGSALAASEDIIIDCGYNETGILQAECQPRFILPGQVIAIKFDQGVKRLKIMNDATEGASNGFVWGGSNGSGGQLTLTSEKLIALDAIDANDDISDNAQGQVLGTAWAEASKAPEGWEDALFDREGYCQIFKTACNLFSGTSMATKYRGIANEFQRVWTEKLMEHKMDLEHAFLFGNGGMGHDVQAGPPSVEGTGAPTRYTHGIVPYTEANGKVYNFSYASSGYDAFLDAMEDFFAPEGGNSGNKLVLASRKVITYLNKLGSGSFLNNSVGASQYSLDVQNIKGTFGHMVTKVNTIYGNLHFVADPLLRGPWENYCVGVDMKNVAYRPLAGNGINRDTFIETNIQDNDVDGRKDQIITEAGLEIQLPETHAIMKWS